MLKSTDKVCKPAGKPPNAGKGRAKGVPNKTTADVREAIAKVLQLNVENFSVWLAKVAEGVTEVTKTTRGKRRTVWLSRPDPARAMELALSMAEYHIPKLARTELTGAGGGPVIIQSTPTDEAL